LWLLLAALVIGSVIGVFYYLRVAITLFRQPEGESVNRAFPSLDPLANATLVVLSAGLVILGIFPGQFIYLIEIMISHLG
jgi:NADH-quinone oxidoreductase subunit N